MVKFNLFLDPLRNEEINLFYDACQMQREYYKGYPKSFHPLAYFRDGEFMWQCPPEMSQHTLAFQKDRYYGVGSGVGSCIRRIQDNIDGKMLLALITTPCVYLSFPPFHVKYKQPTILPPTTERTSGIPPMPERTLAGRYNKAACKVYIR